MPRQSISFTPPNDNWLQMQVDSQEYKSKTELVNEIIRKARSHQSEIEEIRAELIMAEASGFTDLTGEEIRKVAKQQLKIDGLV